MCDSDAHKRDFNGIVSLVNLKEVEDAVWTQYIGRENSYYDLPQSIFANPYRLDEYDRESSIRLYELWLFQNIYNDKEFYSDFQDLEGEVLACWCLPEACHGEVLCDAVVAEADGELDSYVQSRFSQLRVNLFGYSEAKAQTEEALTEAGLL